jgi:hypothetical protein
MVIFHSYVKLPEGIQGEETAAISPAPRSFLVPGSPKMMTLPSSLEQLITCFRKDLA